MHWPSDWLFIYEQAERRALLDNGKRTKSNEIKVNPNFGGFVSASGKAAN
jgi:hypothetical protein